ncbi:MAG: hypothetical protein HOI95_22320 [Chromatiales bacterium]|jgi:hypothetical protein|nr:hypothetical protein [Chromatiales bacterium]
MTHPYGLLTKSNDMAPKVPNYNALSSLLDRLAIENIKLSFFENALEHDELDAETEADYGERVQSQHTMISVLKADTVELMREAIANGEYDFVEEGRTFK